MPLFPALLRLASDRRGCTEDFFTEAAAEVMRRHPAVLWRWLPLDREPHRWAPYDPDRDAVQIRTQVRKRPISGEARSGHQQDSIIDFVAIRLRQGRGEKQELRDVVYAESKIAAGLGHQQLERYRTHLNQEQKREKTTNALLILATRDAFTPDHAADEHVRWSRFYRALAPIPDCPLVDETRTLMEHLRMDDSRTLTPQDLFVASALVPTLRKLEAVLVDVGKTTAFKHLSAGANKTRVATPQVTLHGRLVLQATLNDKAWGRGDTAGLALFAGFRLSAEGEGLVAYVFAEIPGKWSRRDAMRKRFRAFESEHREWSVRDENERYTKLCRAMLLAELVGEKDGLDRVVAFFEESLQMLAAENGPQRAGAA